MTNARLISFILLVSALFVFANCEGGLEPPKEEPDPTGVITGIVTYSGEWPPADSLERLLFVPLKSAPQTAKDIFADIENLVFSEELDYFVERDTFTVVDVPNGRYIYNAVAQQYGSNLFEDWRPVGLYEENGGIININDDTVSISIHVDFDNLPPFPPE